MIKKTDSYLKNKAKTHIGYAMCYQWLLGRHFGNSCTSARWQRCPPFLDVYMSAFHIRWIRSVACAVEVSTCNVSALSCRHPNEEKSLKLVVLSYRGGAKSKNNEWRRCATKAKLLVSINSW